MNKIARQSPCRWWTDRFSWKTVRVNKLIGLDLRLCTYWLQLKWGQQSLRKCILLPVITKPLTEALVFIWYTYIRLRVFVRVYLIHTYREIEGERSDLKTGARRASDGFLLVFISVAWSIHSRGRCFPHYQTFCSFSRHFPTTWIRNSSGRISVSVRWISLAQLMSFD